MFDNGFKSARGDAGVALNSALAGIGGCLPIVELNITSIPADDWMEGIIQWKKDIKARYNNSIPKATNRLGILEQESESSMAFHQSISEFRRGNLAGSVHDDAALEALVRRLQNTLWVKRDQIWKKGHTGPPDAAIKTRRCIEESDGVCV